MQKKLITGLIYLALLVSYPLYANESYGGLDYANLKYEQNGADDAKLAALLVKAGTSIYKNLFVEGQVGFGLQNDSVTYLSVENTLKLDSFKHIGIKGLSSINDVISTKWGIGYSEVTMTASALNTSRTRTESDISYSLGTEILITKSSAISVEYSRILAVEIKTLSALSFGINTKF